MQSYNNVLSMMASIKSGSHIKVTIRSAMAKLNRRKLEARRRREFVAMAKQTSKFPSEPKTQTIALIVISKIPTAMGRKQLFTFFDDSFMMSSRLMYCTA